MKVYKCQYCGTEGEEFFYTYRASSSITCKKCRWDRVSDQHKQYYIDNREEILEKAKVADSLRYRERLLEHRVMGARTRARRNGLEYELSNEWIRQKLEEQNGKCYISGVELSLEPDNWHTVSIDRLDSHKGYTLANSVLVTWFVNYSKREIPLEEYKELINEIVAPKS